MKAFISALAALGIMVGLIIINCVYINRQSEKLKDLADDIEENENAIYEIKDLWEKEKFKICLSTPHKTTDEIEKYINLIIENPENLIEYKTLLLDAIDEIKKHETISFDSIF